VRLIPVEAHPHVHCQRHIQHRSSVPPRSIAAASPPPPPQTPARHTPVRRVRGQSPHCPLRCMFNTAGWSTNPLRASVRAERPVESSRASPPHRPREDRLTHHAATSRTNLATALGRVSRWLSKPSFKNRSMHENPDSAHPGTRLTHAPCPLPCTCVRTAAHSRSGGSPGLTVCVSRDS
jgi:hypothetical protein